MREDLLACALAYERIIAGCRIVCTRERRLMYVYSRTLKLCKQFGSFEHNKLRMRIEPEHRESQLENSRRIRYLSVYKENIIIY